MLRTEPAGTPRLPGQHRDVLPGSPTAILAIFAEIIRERFRPENGLAWVWDGNPVPKGDAAGTNTSPRKILIEPAYSESSEVRNFRPAIYVDKGPTQPAKIVLGNLAGQQLSTGLRAFHSMATIPINVTVESSRKGESGTLADIVWFYLMAGIEPIRATFDFHEISMPVLGSTAAIEKDKTGWVTQVSFAITANFRWTTVPMAPVLREVVQRLSTNAESAESTIVLR